MFEKNIQNIPPAVASPWSSSHQEWYEMVHIRIVTIWYENSQGHYLYEPVSCIVCFISGEEARRYTSFSPWFITSRHDVTVLVKRCLRLDQVLKWLTHRVCEWCATMPYFFILWPYFCESSREWTPLEINKGSCSITYLHIGEAWGDLYHTGSAILGTATEGCAAGTCDCKRNAESNLAPSGWRDFRQFVPLHSCSGRPHKRKAHRYIMVSKQQLLRFPDPLTLGNFINVSLTSQYLGFKQMVARCVCVIGFV